MEKNNLDPRPPALAEAGRYAIRWSPLAAGALGG